MTSQQEALRRQFEDSWLPKNWSRERAADEDGDEAYTEDWVQGAWICYRDLAALSQQAAHPIATSIKYPEEWDTAAYPTLESALDELAAWHKASSAQQAAQEPQPVKLQHMAYAEDGLLHWCNGRKIADCELYAMPDFGRAPVLYAAAPAKPAEIARLRELIADDAFAVSFQSMRQYRTNLLSYIDRCILDEPAEQEKAQYSAVEQLSELMRGLEIGHALAGEPPRVLYVIGQAIATQAKKAAEAEQQAPSTAAMEALELIAAYPKTRADELSAESMRKLARGALAHKGAQGDKA